MRHIALEVMWVAAVLSLVGCSPSMKVTAERVPGANLYSYGTYAWLASPPKDPMFSNASADLLDWRVHSAVDAALHARGYARATTDSPDLWVRYRIHFRETNVESFQDYYWYRRAGGTESPQDTFVFGYEEAALIIELLDARTQQMVWRASATAPRGAESEQDRVAQAVRLMFERYPILAVSQPPS